MKKIDFDESGNTGAALCDVNQPVFCLASVDFSDEEAHEVLSQINANSQQSELKFSNLKKRENGRSDILKIIKSISLNPKKVKTCALHKPFMIVAKAVDLIIEPAARRDGLDIYKHGLNIAFLNMFYHGLESFFGQNDRTKFIESFEKMIRLRSSVATELFFNGVRYIYIKCRNSEFRGMIAAFLAAKSMITEILAETAEDILDPAIPSLVSSLVSWGTHYADFDVVHDRSKPIAKNISLFEDLFKEKGVSEIIGYDRRRFSMPLKARRIVFGDSVTYKQLQIADIVAGATAFFGMSRASGIDNNFANELADAGVEKFKVMNLWPSWDVTPGTLGTSGDVGSNPQDSMEPERWLNK